MTTTWFSLRRRLLILISGGAFVCWLATLAWSYLDAHHEIDELFDAQLVQTAQTLLMQRHRLRAGHDDDEDDDEDEPRRPALVHPYQSRLVFQIWHADGGLLARSPGAPMLPLTDDDGFSENRSGDRDWRYYSQWDERHRHRVLVAEDQHDRHELIARIALRIALPMLLILPLLGAWVWIATRRGLQPLTDVAGEIAARKPERLEPVSPPRAPEEIRPLLESLNQLFARVERALDAERRFTADAAHELRTPLAALATQAQVALRARDEDERHHALDQLTASSRRAGRLVDQLLVLARLDPADGAPLGQVDLYGIAEETCADHGPAALAKNIALELDGSPTTVCGNAGLLRILLRNLVDNAIRYTPPGGRVHVQVGTHMVTVTDDGPGIPESERERVFDRFRRLAGQDTEGSGLGLSIVRRIAERHGARVNLHAGMDGPGLCVKVEFPVSDRPAPTGAS